MILLSHGGHFDHPKILFQSICQRLLAIPHLLQQRMVAKESFAQHSGALEKPSSIRKEHPKAYHQSLGEIQKPVFHTQVYTICRQMSHIGRLETQAVSVL
jgi:hypothetical protein